MSKKIRIGKVDPFPQNVETKDELIRISMMIEGDLLDELKARASESNLPYQTYLKQLLRRALAQTEFSDIEARFDRLNKKASALEKQFGRVQLQARRPRPKKKA